MHKELQMDHERERSHFLFLNFAHGSSIDIFCTQSLHVDFFPSSLERRDPFKSTWTQARTPGHTLSTQEKDSKIPRKWHMLFLHSLDSPPPSPLPPKQRGGRATGTRRASKMSAFSATRATFSFHRQPISPSASKPTIIKTPIRFPFPSPSRPKPFIRLSLDVSKEDKPLADPEENPDAEADPQSEKLGPRREDEKFIVLNTGVYECRSCGYLYDQKVGDPSYPVPPGLGFETLPEDWRCPTCGAAKSFFDSRSVEIAGFAQNQQFGLGGNSLTSGQKVTLIYGTLAFFFVLFLSGYFIQ